MAASSGLRTLPEPLWSVLQMPPESSWSVRQLSLAQPLWSMQPLWSEPRIPGTLPRRGRSRRSG